MFDTETPGKLLIRKMSTAGMVYISIRFKKFSS